jgi:hypothetical protein
MEFLGPYGWLFAIAGGVVLLGLFLAFGMRRTAQLTPREAAARDAATHKAYAEAEAERQPEDAR